MQFASVLSHAQDQHFVYLQTENKQPFYVILKSVTYNSSASGYLIIPKLLNDTYNITVGFPKNEFPKQALSFVVNNNDLGYLLKNFGESGWGLFNLNSMKVTMGASANDPSIPKSSNNSDDFTKTLSEVVSTDLSSVSKNPVPVKVQNEKKIGKQIKLISNVNDASGRQMVYVAFENNYNDTITVFIPAATQTPSIEIVNSSNKQEEVITNNNIPESEIPSANQSGKSSKGNLSKLKMINSDCKNIANDKDFLKLRKLMAAKNSEDAMVQVASKEFRKTCFSTDNLKNLSMLFFTDKGRYSFFDAAYSHVYDSDNFGTLKTLLTDNYYITRFEAMIHK